MDRDIAGTDERHGLRSHSGFSEPEIRAPRREIPAPKWRGFRPRLDRAIAHHETARNGGNTHGSTQDPAFSRRPRRQFAQTASAHRGATEIRARRARRRGTAPHRARCRARGGKAAGGDRAAACDRWRIPALVVAPRFPATDRECPHGREQPEVAIPYAGGHTEMSPPGFRVEGK